MHGHTILKTVYIIAFNVEVSEVCEISDLIYMNFEMCLLHGSWVTCLCHSLLI